jgi:hypothetical protein
MSNRTPNCGRHFNPAPDEPVRLTLHVPESLVRSMDSLRGYTTRVEWIRSAIRERLEQGGTPRPPGPQVVPDTSCATVGPRAPQTPVSTDENASQVHP